MAFLQTEARRVPPTTGRFAKTGSRGDNRFGEAALRSPHAPALAAKGATRDGVKRVLDFLGALFGLLLAGPVMLAIVAALSFNGSPLFRQVRIGRGGRRFVCLKFRTMHVDAESALTGLTSVASPGGAWSTHQKLVNDPRVTRMGGFLRRWGLDELPQLFNVLKGEMSLVGPRPIISPDTPGYPADAAYARSASFSAYVAVRPGLTGLWQVMGGADTAHSTRIALDQEYVRRRSVWLDLRIILVTPIALIRRKTS